MTIYNTGEVLGELDRCIKHDEPFSHIRFGDGGIKFLHSVLYDDQDQLQIIIRKEGLPPHKIVEIFELWGYYARAATFIDSPEVYFNNTFWPRVKKPGKAINSDTELKLRDWYKYYDDAEFDNESYCNPESNYLMILKTSKYKNIFDLMKKRRVCIISVFPRIKYELNKLKYKADIVQIVAHYQNQYKNSFTQVTELIKEKATSYDFWLVAAGELGRIYSGLIKEYGGRTIDIGFVIEYWLTGYIHPRLHAYLTRNKKNKFELSLTEKGREYLEYI